MTRPKSAHDHAVTEARMRTFVHIVSEDGTVEYFKLLNQRIQPLSADDRAFLITEGVLAI